MKKPQQIALLCALALTLVLSGVSAFALQPSINNPVSETTGFWQNQKQDGSIQYTWTDYICACGVTLYSLDVEHPVLMGDIVNICSTAGTGQLTYADCGLVADYTVDDPHNSSSHALGQFLIGESSEGVIYTLMSKPATPASLVILIESTGSETLLTDRAFYTSNIVGSATNTVRTYALINTLSSIYDQNIYNKGLSDGYGVARDEFYNEGYQAGYSDGQINGQENINAIDLIAEVIDGVSLPIIDAMYGISFFGVSLMTLAGFVITITLIMFILKIVRG